MSAADDTLTVMERIAAVLPRLQQLTAQVRALEAENRELRAEVKVLAEARADAEEAVRELQAMIQRHQRVA